MSFDANQFGAGPVQQWATGTAHVRGETEPPETDAGGGGAGRRWTRTARPSTKTGRYNNGCDSDRETERPEHSVNGVADGGHVH